MWFWNRSFWHAELVDHGRFLLRRWLNNKTFGENAGKLWKAHTAFFSLRCLASGLHRQAGEQKIVKNVQSRVLNVERLAFALYCMLRKSSEAAGWTRTSLCCVPCWSFFPPLLWGLYMFLHCFPTKGSWLEPWFEKVISGRFSSEHVHQS